MSRACYCSSAVHPDNINISVSANHDRVLAANYDCILARDHDHHTRHFHNDDCSGSSALYGGWAAVDSVSNLRPRDYICSGAGHHNYGTASKLRGRLLDYNDGRSWNSYAAVRLSAHRKFRKTDNLISTWNNRSFLLVHDDLPFYMPMNIDLLFHDVHPKPCNI